MDITGVVAPFFQPHLTNRFQERQGFDITDRTPHLNDRHFSAFCTQADMPLDFVGDVWNHLHCLAKVFATPLLLDD